MRPAAPLTDLNGPPHRGERQFSSYVNTRGVSNAVFFREGYYAQIVPVESKAALKGGVRLDVNHHTLAVPPNLDKP